MARLEWASYVLCFVVTSDGGVCSQDHIVFAGGYAYQGQEDPVTARQCVKHSLMQRPSQRTGPQRSTEAVEDVALGTHPGATRPQRSTEAVEDDALGTHPGATRQNQSGASMPEGASAMEVARQATELVATPAPTPPPKPSFVLIHGRAKLALLRLSSLTGRDSEFIGIVVVLLGILVCTIGGVLGAFVLADGTHHSSDRQSRLGLAFGNRSLIDTSSTKEQICTQASAPELPMPHRAQVNRFSEPSATPFPNEQPIDFQKLHSSRSSIASVEHLGHLDSDSPVSNDPVLCAGLVVPEDNECVLAIRALSNGSCGLTSCGTLDIMDIQGKPVLQALIRTRASTFRPNASVSSQVPLVTLHTLVPGSGPSNPNDTNVLARCRLREGSNGKRSMYFYSGFDELFGIISLDPSSGSKGQNRYVFRYASSDCEIAFEGNYFTRQMVVVDRFQAVLADIEPWTMVFEPAKPYCKVRITSRFDVGLVLCGFLAVERLELEDP